MPFFYKKTPTSSLDQFSKDFGDFPPQPLNSRMKNNRFDIISLSGLGSKYYTISRISRVFRRDPEKETDPIAKEMIEEIKDSLLELKGSVSEFRFIFGELNFLKKIFVILVIIISFPVLLSFIFFVFFKSIYSLYKIKSIGTESLGFFSPKNQDKSEIVIRPAAVKKTQISSESVLSHEHVHLMQNVVFIKDVGELIDADFGINVKKFLNSNELKSKLAFYHLSLHEVEARLHEIVLSYYREYGSLPVDYQGFLSLILSSELLGDYVSSILSEHSVVLPEKYLPGYKLREVVPGEDIICMFTYFENRLYAKRFICEALSVMYGNLLLIYGDSKNAFDYLHTIECQDFYDQMYGKYAAPVMRMKGSSKSEV